MSAQKASKDQEKRIREINERHRDNMLQQIDDVTQNKDRTLVNEITKIMDRQYRTMRQIAGIDVEHDHSDGSDYETEKVFRQLRPDAGYKLMDLLTGKVK